MAGAPLCSLMLTFLSLSTREIALGEVLPGGRGRGKPTSVSRGLTALAPTLGPAHCPRSLLTSLLDAGGWGGGHRLGSTAEPVGGGPSRRAWGQGPGRRPPELPHPLLALVLSPLPVHVLGIPGGTLWGGKRRPGQPCKVRVLWGPASPQGILGQGHRRNPLVQPPPHSRKPERPGNDP